jgi:hypothetical protein
MEREEAIREVAVDLLALLKSEEHPEARYSAAVQLASLGRAQETIAPLGELVEAPVGECRTRAAQQLGRIGAPAMEAFAALVRAAVNREDEGLALTAIEALNLIDPENLIGAPQLVRLLRRRVLRMWRGGAFLRIAVDEALFLRLVRALSVTGRHSDDAQLELEHLAGNSTGRLQAAAREALESLARAAAPAPET